MNRRFLQGLQRVSFCGETLTLKQNLDHVAILQLEVLSSLVVQDALSIEEQAGNQSCTLQSLHRSTLPP